MSMLSGLRKLARARRRTFDLQEGGQQLVLVLLGGNRVCELLAIVEWLQKGLKPIVVGHWHFRDTVMFCWEGCVGLATNVYD